MTRPDSVEGDEHLRLFAALPLPPEAVERLVAWQSEELADTRDARLVPAENLHVTLAFLGRRPAEDAEEVLGVLREVATACERPVLAASGYRETRSVGMVLLDDEDGRAARIAGAVGEGLERLGAFERERRRWLPHVTVLRFRRPPRARPSVPDAGRGQSVRTGALSFGAATDRGAVRDSPIGSSGRLTT